MKGIIWRFKRFESEDVKKSTWPKEIKKYQEFEKEAKKFLDVIGIWLCIEKDDKEEYLNFLVERVIKLNNQLYKLKKIVILPFVHLSNRIEEPKKSKEIFEKLVERLKEKGFETYRISFGTHKRLLWEIPGQIGEASYFEFPYSGEKLKI